MDIISNEGIQSNSNKIMKEVHGHLNQAQQQAVTIVHGPVLVIAGAGSGKTRVIEYRVLHLVSSGIPPTALLLLTFTRRAAREMLSRACSHDIRCRNVDGGTFHSFAYKVLKKHSHLVGFDSFTILDEADAQEALALCARNTGACLKEKSFPKKDTLKSIISKSLNKRASVEAVLEKEYGHFLEYASQISKIQKTYARYKREKGYMDYDDLLLHLKDLLAHHAKIRQELNVRYQFLMVDEYQDTNPLQGEITYLLGAAHRNVFVVGDDAQSIYGFRGASHENIMEFPKRFPGCKIITLQENYRSSQPILDLANEVLATMQKKFSKHLVSSSGKSGPMPQLLFFGDIYEEAQWLVNKIKELYDQGQPLGHQAVLFRAAYISIPLQAELSRRGIPYQVFGGMKFYETAHVKDMMSYLKIVHNPKDELAWSRLLMLIDGIGPKTSQQLLENIKGCGCLGEVAAAVCNTSGKVRTYSQSLKKLGIFLESTQQEPLSIESLCKACLEYYYPILKAKFDDWDSRLKDLEAVEAISQRYQALGDFLADFAIEPLEGPFAAAHTHLQEHEKPLVLSTIHSAKGLEWNYVFIIGLIDGILPVSFSLKDEESIDEERRLFYVGVTRAKDALFLSLHEQGQGFGALQFDRMSRFIDSPKVLSKVQKIWLPTGNLTPEYEQD